MSAERAPRRTRRLSVDALARVEGEGAVLVRIRDGHVEDVELRIYEPPRFFEALLRGRGFDEPVDIAARICGICPVAYQMSAVRALEAASGVTVDPGVDELRRLLYCGEWIESHALHVHLLHAPDFLGYESAIHMARDHPAEVERGLRLKKAGNAIMILIGGREIHPVNVRVGGFWKVPTRRQLQPLTETLRRARDDATAVVRWVAGFPFPEQDHDYEFVALRDGDRYPILGDRIVSNRGLDIAVADFDDHIVEVQVARSTALHARLRERGTYMVGPLARYALGSDRLHDVARAAARDAGLGPVCRNPFQSIVVRAVETLHACEEALRIIESYRPPDAPYVEVPPRAGTGHGATEAPRGMLHHRYRLAEDGTVLDARIVPPTSQNQRVIEEDVREVVERHLDLDDAALTWRVEQAIRNHDPCISCAAHFLRMEVSRT